MANEFGGSFQDFERAAARIDQASINALQRAEEAERIIKRGGSVVYPRGSDPLPEQKGLLANQEALNRATREHINLLQRQGREMRSVVARPVLPGVDPAFLELQRLQARQQQSAGIGAVFGGGGGNGRPPTGGGGGGGTGPIDPDEFKKRQDVAEVIQLQQQRMGSLRKEMSLSSAEASASSQNLRKYGAATTEFIEAAARGETTLGELGYQLAATTGKFAAWTAASVGVFGVLAAFREVGTGAIESASGVNELQRFIANLDTDQAQQDFRNLSREMNLPIADVTEAYAQMGRVFNDQDDALQGARAVLKAVRVGSLEVGDAVRFLGAIVQGFRLPASSLEGVIDQINQAQNKLNFSIRDGAAGIARAAGSWRAAGGTFSQLLAIMATAQRSTGATGEVVGTALRRSAEFTGREENQRRLREFGVDPTGGIDNIYRQAFGLVQSGAVQGQDITRLATALSSPQLAAVLGPTLQNYQLFQRALRDTSPQASAGSANRELAIQLASVRERIARIGTDLQQLGSNLAQAGLLLPIQAFIVALDQGLRLTNALISGFNEIPAPLRQAVVLGAQLYGVMRLMRRLNVGESLINRAELRGQTSSFGQFIQGPPENNSMRRIRTALREESKALIDEQERVSRSARTASMTAYTAQSRVGGVIQGGPAQGENIRQFNQRVLESQAAASAARTRYLDLTNEETAINTRLREVNTRNADILREANISAARGVAAAERMDIYVRRNIGTPSAEGITDVRGGTVRPGDALRGEAGLGVTPGGLIVPGSYVDASRQQAEETRRMERATREKLGFTDSVRQHGVIMGGYKVAADRGAAAAGTIGRRAGEAKAASVRAAARLRQAAAGLNQLFGPLDLALIGLIATYEIFTIDKKAIEKAAALQNDLATRAPTTRAGRRDYRDDLERQAKAGDSFGERLGDFSQNALHLFGARPESPGDRRRRIAREQLARERRSARERLDAIAGGGFIPEAQTTDIDAATQNAADDLDKGIITVAQFRERIADILDSIRRSSLLNPGQQAAKVSQVQGRALSLDPGNVRQEFNRLNDLTDDALKERLKAFQDLAKGGDLGGRESGQFVREAVEQITRLRGAERTPQNLALLAEARRSLVEGIEGQAKARLDEDLELSRTQRDKDAAYRRYFRTTSPATVTRRLGAAQKSIIAEAAATSRGIAEAQRELRENATGSGQGSFLGRVPGSIGALNRIAGLKRRLDGLRKNLRENDQEIKRAERELERLRQDRREERYESSSELRQARGALAQARLPEGIARTERALRDIGREIDAAIKVYGEGDVRVLALMQQQADLRNQRFDDIANRIEARGRLREAQAGPTGGGDVRLGTLRETLALRRKQGADQAVIDGLRADIIEQERQNAEEQRRRAQEDIEALFGLRSSLTDDPVALARLAVQQAEALRKAARGGTRNERRNADAEVNRRRRDLAETVSNRKLEDIDLDKDIGRITMEQQIAAYEEVLRTTKAGVEFKRQLRNRIAKLKHDLENDDSETELNVGNIKLPTAYEVRRFVQGGASGAFRSNNVQNTNTWNIEIANPDAAEAFWRGAENVIGTSTEMTALASGMR